MADRRRRRWPPNPGPAFISVDTDEFEAEATRSCVDGFFQFFFPIRFKLKNSFVTENLIAYDAQINTIDQSFGKMMSLGVLNVSLRMVVYYNNTLIILIQTNNSKKYLLLFFNATWNYRW